jgi:hypothetical protein
MRGILGFSVCGLWLTALAAAAPAGAHIGGLGGRQRRLLEPVNEHPFPHAGKPEPTAVRKPRGIKDQTPNEAIALLDELESATRQTITLLESENCERR